MEQSMDGVRHPTLERGSAAEGIEMDAIIQHSEEYIDIDPILPNSLISHHQHHPEQTPPASDQASEPLDLPDRPEKVELASNEQQEPLPAIPRSIDISPLKDSEVMYHNTETSVKVNGSVTQQDHVEHIEFIPRQQPMTTPQDQSSTTLEHGPASNQLPQIDLPPLKDDRSEPESAPTQHEHALASISNSPNSIQLKDLEREHVRPGLFQEHGRSMEIAALILHSVGGRSFCSRAVTCDILTSPDLRSNTLRLENVNPFQTLPPSITSTILEYASEIDSTSGRIWAGSGPSDGIPTYWIPNLDFQVVESRLRAQEEAMRTLSTVCRMFRTVISPWKWHTLRVNPNQSCSQISSGLKLALPDQPVHLEPSRSDGSVGHGADDRIEPKILISGHLVKHLVLQPPLPTCDIIGTWLLSCPNLTHISFIRPNNPNIYPTLPDDDDDVDLQRISISESFLKEMTNFIPITIRTISGLHLPSRAAIHNPPGASTTSASNFYQDNVINMLNYARHLDTLSISNINFTGSYGQRILFVMKLNSKLLQAVAKKSSEGLAGALSTIPSPPAGILNLDLGPGSLVDLEFMNGLKTAAPDLTHIHLQSGSTLNAHLSMSRPVLGASPSSAVVGLDLREFLMSFSARLQSFSFVCSVTDSITATNTASTGNGRYCHQGVLDDVTRYCQELKALHITSDLITFQFFENLLIEDPINGSSLKLKYLRIDFDNLGAASPLSLIDSYTPSFLKYIELKSKSKILEFSKIAEEIRSSGIDWPSGSCWSRRDLLTRMRWLANEREVTNARV